jgi:hypothetical protein
LTTVGFLAIYSLNFLFAISNFAASDFFCFSSSIFLRAAAVSSGVLGSFVFFFSASCFYFSNKACFSFSCFFFSSSAIALAVSSGVLGSSSSIML